MAEGKRERARNGNKEDKHFRERKGHGEQLIWKVATISQRPMTSSGSEVWGKETQRKEGCLPKTIITFALNTAKSSTACVE